MAIVEQRQSSALASIGQQWEVEYSRFFRLSSLSSSSASSLTPLSGPSRARLRGTWLSSSPSSISASLKLSSVFSKSDFVLSVSFLGKLHEEHYISKLNFTWPHVSCMSGFPPRGSRALLVSYKDSSDQIQKFALRFSAGCNVEAFIGTLKELMQLPKETGNKSDEKIVSEISSESDFVPFEEAPYRPVEDWNSALPTYRSLDQLESHFNSEDAKKTNLPQTTVLNHGVGNMSQGLPPSFMSLMMSSTQPTLQEVKPTLSQQADFKLKLMSYLDNSSFQDIMGKVEAIMSEIGNDTMLM